MSGSRVQLDRRAAVDTPAPSTDRRLYELDLGRMLAAMAVVLFHYSFVGPRLGTPEVLPSAIEPFAKYGNFGVQFFFILSGFVITLGRPDRTPGEFLKNRVVRLYPVYWVAVFLTAAATLAVEPERWFDALVNLTMFQQAFGVAHIDGAYWSLFVELKFYGLFTLVLLFRARAHLENILIGWLTLAAVGLADVPIFNGSFIRELFILQYASYFIAGAVIALSRIEREWTARRKALIAISWMVSMAQVVIGVRSIEFVWDVESSEFAALLIVTGCFAVMVLAGNDKLAWLRRPRFAIVGAMSYPMYVLHQDLGYRAFRTLPGPHLLLGFGALFVVLAVSYTIARWVEPLLAERLRFQVNRFSRTAS